MWWWRDTEKSYHHSHIIFFLYFCYNTARGMHRHTHTNTQWLASHSTWLFTVFLSSTTAKQSLSSCFNENTMFFSSYNLHQFSYTHAPMIAPLITQHAEGCSDTDNGKQEGGDIHFILFYWAKSEMVRIECTDNRDHCEPAFSHS